jgi:hypothetical protein
VLKLALAGAVLVAFAAFTLHSRGGGKDAAQVASCLEKHGATAARSTFLREAMGISDDAQVPGSLKKVEEHLFDVTVGSDSGLLLDTTHSDADTRITAAAAAQGLDVTPQSRGKVMLVWFGGPSAESRALADGCL